MIVVLYHTRRGHFGLF